MPRVRWEGLESQPQVPTLTCTYAFPRLRSQLRAELAARRIVSPGDWLSRALEKLAFIAEIPSLSGALMCYCQKQAVKNQPSVPFHPWVPIQRHL